jgi:hypothetical protein
MNKKIKGKLMSARRPPSPAPGPSQSQPTPKPTQTRSSNLIQQRQHRLKQTMFGPGFRDERRIRFPSPILAILTFLVGLRIGQQYQTHSSYKVQEQTDKHPVDNESTHIHLIEPRRGQDPSTYDHAYNVSRKFFSYESPLPKWPPHPAGKRKFSTLLKLFDWREAEQLQLWNLFIKAGYVKTNHYDLLHDHLGMFPDLDRVFIYCLVRHVKPGRVFEIGSGESTGIVREALRHGHINCKQLAIEPYRFRDVPNSVEVVKKEVQELNEKYFDELIENDILFIDSSHVTMPYGDTLAELLTILPRLNRGVLVHIHDIFLPYDYPENWSNKNYVYTEQWLVALMLYGAGAEWEVVWGSKLMKTVHTAQVLSMPSYPLRNGQSQPTGGSLWLRKVGDPIRS